MRAPLFTTYDLQQTFIPHFLPRARATPYNLRFATEVYTAYLVARAVHDNLRFATNYIQVSTYLPTLLSSLFTYLDALLQHRAEFYDLQ